MNIGKLILAIIVAAVAIWLLLTLKTTTGYIGGVFLIILSLIWVITGSKKKAA
jgi:hypothetical protein